MYNLVRSYTLYKPTKNTRRKETEMTTLTASNTRIPRNVFAKVVHEGERVRITKYDEEVYLVSKEDMELLQAIEDSTDIILADEVMERIRKGEEKTIPWEAAKKELGL